MRHSVLLLAALSPWACAQMQTIVPVMVRVPATSNPYLAGMPDGTRARREDRAPQQSPVLVPVSLQGVEAVRFRATGGMNHAMPPCPPQCDTPDGSLVTEHLEGAEHGISDVRAPINSLMGVFLTDDPPNRTRAPKDLDFRARRREFITLAPALKQVFFIGTGSNRAGVMRRYLVPKGATRLFLGAMDGFDWWNDTGGFSVAVTVERPEVTSNVTSVDSSVVYAKWACAPFHTNCTPDRAIVEARPNGQYHIVMPAPMAWGVSIPNPSGAAIAVSKVQGTVCMDVSTNSFGSCNGSKGSGGPAGAEFLVPSVPAGALVFRTEGGRTYFSVNGYFTDRVRTQEGYFEFDVTIR